MNILEFIFKDIWHFLGTCLLLEIIGDCAVDIVREIRKIIMSIIIDNSSSNVKNNLQ